MGFCVHLSISPSGNSATFSVFFAPVTRGVCITLLSVVLKSIIQPIFHIFPSFCTETLPKATAHIEPIAVDEHCAGSNVYFFFYKNILVSVLNNKQVEIYAIFVVHITVHNRNDVFAVQGNVPYARILLDYPADKIPQNCRPAA